MWHRTLPHFWCPIMAHSHDCHLVLFCSHCGCWKGFSIIKNFVSQLCDVFIPFPSIPEVSPADLVDNEAPKIQHETSEVPLSLNSLLKKLFAPFDSFINVCLCVCISSSNQRHFKQINAMFQVCASLALWLLTLPNWRPLRYIARN